MAFGNVTWKLGEQNFDILARYCSPTHFSEDQEEAAGSPQLQGLGANEEPEKENPIENNVM